MAYWRLFYHIVWATNNRLPLLVPEIEQAVFRTLWQKCVEVSAQPIAVNGMPDHVHVIAAVPPTLALARFVQVLKGSSSRFVHVEFARPFAWQEGYGVFSLSERSLQAAAAYVRNQKAHHQAGTIILRLERAEIKDDGPRSPADAGE
jgi:putative transposase